MGELVKSPWDQKPGINEKLEIDEAMEAHVFEDFDEDSIEFDDEDRENDMVFDYKAARKNAHFAIHASKKILQMIAHNLTYERNPLIVDGCVKLVKVIAENNRDLIKIHKDFKSTKLIGKPKPGEGVPETETGDREDTVKASVSEVVNAARKEKE